MDLNVSYVNSASSPRQKNGSAAIFHPGSIVRGRVLSSDGGGRYTLSVAGHRVEVLSEFALRPGSSFSAKVGSSGHTVVFKMLSGSARGGGVETISVSNFSPENPALVSLLDKLGLPPSIECFRLLQFAVGMGIKPDGNRLMKALARGKKEKDGNSIEKSQTALLLEEKGVNATDLAVEKVTAGFYGSPGHNHSRGGAGGEDEGGGRDERERLDSGTFKDDVSAYFKSVDEAVRLNRPGALTLFNMLCAQRKDEPHWVVFPFEWDFNHFYGAVRVLLTADKKNVQKLVINIQNESKKYTFVLYFKGKRLDSAKVSPEPFGSKIDSDSILRLAESLFGQVNVSMPDQTELEGFAAEDTGIGVFEGEA